MAPSATTITMTNSSEPAELSSPGFEPENSGQRDAGYPSGHLGYLTDAESEAFSKFKACLAEKGTYEPGKHGHDDASLLRFLRARRWDVEDAYQQFNQTEEWRTANQVDILYDTIEVDSYEESRLLYPRWTGRRDRRGIPLYLFKVRPIDPKAYEQSSEANFSEARTDGKTPGKLLRLLALYENMTRFAHPLCSELDDREHAATPITLATNIVDITGVSLRQFWNLKSHMQAAAQMATAHYPETLDRIFIVGAPVFFSTVWAWLKRWFDPVTVSKIFILAPNDVVPTLRAYIDPANIPKAYGGQLDFEWPDLPAMDPKFREVAIFENGFTDFPVGPLYWRPMAGGDRMECIAVGSVNHVRRAQRVCTMPRSCPTGTEEAQDSDTDSDLRKISDNATVPLASVTV